jgi:DNA-directed RNA polymerase subunit RPC12/RpoP
MPLRDPVAIYVPASNMEAHLICEALHNAGIDAHAVEDVSQVGTWMFGLVSQIHKPQVWVERADVKAAKPILEEYERRAKVNRDAKNAKRGSPDMIEVVCEECGRSSRFPIEQEGSVQDCPHCGAYIDVEEAGSDDDWGEPDADEPDESDHQT